MAAFSQERRESSEAHKIVRDLQEKGEGKTAEDLVKLALKKM